MIVSQAQARRPKATVLIEIMVCFVVSISPRRIPQRQQATNHALPKPRPELVEGFTQATRYALLRSLRPELVEGCGWNVN